VGRIHRKTPGGYSYAQTAWHYRVWRQASTVTIHMEHKAGYKTYVDFAGEKFKIVDSVTGEIEEVEMFTSILGASQLTYVEAIPSQKKEDCIRANENAFRKFGGVTATIMPDQLKSAIKKHVSTSLISTRNMTILPSITVQSYFPPVGRSQKIKIMLHTFCKSGFWSTINPLLREFN